MPPGHLDALNAKIDGLQNLVTTSVATINNIVAQVQETVADLKTAVADLSAEEAGPQAPAPSEAPA